MYCENCQLEIKDQEEKNCPLCGGPLTPSAAEASEFVNDQGADFDPLQADAPPFVLDDEEDTGGMGLESPAAPEPPHAAVEQAEQAPTAEPLETAGAMMFSDDSSAEMLDQVLQEYDPLVDAHFKAKKSGSKSTTVLFLILLAVCVLGAGVYYFMMREPEAPPAPAMVAKPKKKDAVLDKVLRKQPVAAPKQAGDNATKQAEKPAAEKPAAAAAKKPAAAVPQPAVEKPEQPPVTAKPAQLAIPQEKPQPAPAVEKPAPAPEPPQAVQEPAPEKPAVQPEAGQVSEPVKAPPEPAPAKAEKPKAPSPGRPVFSVLAGSFRQQSNAEAEAGRLSRLGLDARAVTVDLKGKGQWHRVLIGTWASRAEAKKMLGEVRRTSGKKDAAVIATSE